MPVFITAIWGYLLNIMPSVVGRVLLALGFTYIAYTGFDLSITFLLNQIKSNLAGLPSDIASFFGWLWIDKAVSLIFSSYTAAMAVKTANSTILKRLVLK